MKDAETKRPTNGGTDGDDGVLYNRARNEGLIHIAYVTSIVLNQMLAVIDSTTKAVAMSPMSKIAGGDTAYDGYEEGLLETSKVIVSECNKLSERAAKVVDALSSFDSLEAKEHAESIKLALGKFVKEST